MIRRMGNWKRLEPPRWGPTGRRASCGRSGSDGSTARLLAVQAGVPITLKTKRSPRRRHLTRHPGPTGRPGNAPPFPRSEGTPHSLRVSDIGPGLTLCGVPSEHTYSLGCGSQGECPGLVCVAPLGQIEQWHFDPAFDRCGLRAKCGNRGRRTRLQWRLGRLRGCFVSAARGNWRARQCFLFFRLHFSELYLFAVFL